MKGRVAVMREQDMSHGRGGVLKKASVGTQHRKKQEDQPFLSRLDQKGVPVLLSIDISALGEGKECCPSLLLLLLPATLPFMSAYVALPLVVKWRRA